MSHLIINYTILLIVVLVIIMNIIGRIPLRDIRFNIFNGFQQMTIIYIKTTSLLFQSLL